jgi:hypothetical protein
MPPKNQVGKESKRGGARPGAGRPTGITKEKISISIDSTVLRKALAMHGNKPSKVIEAALIAYTKYK